MAKKTIRPATGAHESPHDEQQWTIAAVGGGAEVYPQSCFLDTSWMVASMQAKQPCCVGSTGEEVVRLISYLQSGVKRNPGSAEELSFRFLYAVAKSVEGKIVKFPDGQTIDFTAYAPTLEGTYPSLVAKLIRKIGVPLARLCPNDTTLKGEEFIYQRDINRIPKEAFADAAARRVGADLTQPVSLEGLQKAITYAKANRGAVMILRRIGNSYWKDENGVSTYDPKRLLPIRAVTPESGHEELLTGYDTDPFSGRLRLYWLNHWSKDWADNGRGWEYADVWLPYIVEIRVVLPELPIAPAGFRYSFTKQLLPGAKGPDVVALQHVLDLEGCYGYTGTPRYTGTYGMYTEAGVKSLQEKYAAEILTPVHLKKGTGIVSERTLSWLENHYAPQG